MNANCPPPVGGGTPFSSLGVIDRVGEAFCQSAQNPQFVADVQRYRTFRMHCLATTLAMVDNCHVPGRAIVSVRLKRLDSIRRKIGRDDSDFKLGRLDDVIGVRVICGDLSTVREFSSRIKNSPYSYRLKDYIISPPSTGYRGINHIMKFSQSVSETAKVDVRFEIQVRTYLQHFWALWSESHGEAVKIGRGTSEEQEHLRTLSDEIARWESDNPDVRQLELPQYSSGQSIIVCWRSRNSRMILHPFLHEVREAVEWLNHLEITYPADRGNALLLIGVTGTNDAKKLLRLTHPLFTGARVPEPEHWMPKSPS